MTIAAGVAPASAERVPPTSTSPDQDGTSDPHNDRTDRTLLRLNAAVRRIDLTFKLVAPLFLSLLASTVGYRFSAVVLLGIGVGIAGFEVVCFGVVYAKLSYIR
jgi:hypothetical protein